MGRDSDHIFERGGVLGHLCALEKTLLLSCRNCCTLVENMLNNCLIYFEQFEVCSPFLELVHPEWGNVVYPCLFCKRKRGILWVLSHGY